MAKTDLERNIADLSDVESGQWWSPKEGKNIIRVLPAWTEKGAHAGKFFLKGALHYGFKSEGRDRAFPCLSMFEKSCPACAFISVLQEEGSEASTAIVKRMRKQYKYWVNILVRTKDGTEKTPRIYGLKKKMMRQLRGYMQDPDYGDITDAEEGRDVVIEREGTGMNTSYELRVRPKATPIGTDDWEEKLHKLHKVVVEPMTEEQLIKELRASYGKLYTKAMGLSESKTTKDDDDDDEEKEEKEEKAKKKDKKEDKKKSADDEDDDEDGEEDEED